MRSIDVLASLVVATCAGIAAPLLDTLGRNVDYLIEHNTTRVDLIVLVALLTIILPLAFAVPVWLAYRVWSPLGVLIHGGVLAALVTVLLLGITARTPLDGAPALVVVIPAAVIAALAAVGYLGHRPTREVVRYGLALPLIIAVLFVTVTPARYLVLPQRSSGAITEVPDPAPVVLVIFDELPLATLVTRAGDIDRQLFPNFARLADTSTWMRNTTTVANFTGQAVPAILDGRRPDTSWSPVAAAHPGNLFELLGGAYDVRAMEASTALCVPPACTRMEPLPPLRARWERLLDDTSIIALHAVLPEDLRADLPAIDLTLGGFRRDTEKEVPPDQWLGHFLAELRPSEAPAAYVFHGLLPHLPWSFLPSGQPYSSENPPRGLLGPRGTHARYWTADPWVVAMSQRRHVLQVQAVDRQLGAILDRLEEQDLLDPSVLVVTSDHGASFVADGRIRGRDELALGGTGWVPLFVKQPGQTEPAVVDAPASTIDVLPTIMDLIGVEDIPGDHDGVSLVAALDPDRVRTLAQTPPPYEPVLNLPADRAPLDQAVARKYAAFAPSSASIDVERFGPGQTEELVGRQIEALLDGEVPAVVMLDGAERFGDVDPDGPYPPVLVTGRVAGLAPTNARSPLAIAVNGRVAVLTQVDDVEGPGSFAAMVLPSWFEEGPNEVEVLLVRGGPDGWRLSRMTSAG